MFNRQDLYTNARPAGPNADTRAQLYQKISDNFDDIYSKLGAHDRISFFDDFLGPTLTTKLAVIAGSDSPAAGAVVVAQNGTLRLTTGDSNASLAADGIQVSGSLNYKANQGGLFFETRILASAVAAIQLCAGFTDQTAALEMPGTLNGTTYTTVATDGAFFLFDTTATTDTIRCAGVATDVDATHVDTGNDFTTVAYYKLRIEISATGVALFYINDALVATVAAAVTPTVALAPVICARSLAANSKTFDVDYLAFGANRA